jgi:hypothetical protein
MSANTLGGDDMPTWSQRSQRSLVKQIGLEKALARCERAAIHFEAETARLEDICAGKTARIAQGSPGADRYHVDLLREAEDAKRQATAFREHAARLRTEIESLQPTPKGLFERAETQARLARLATERLGKDRGMEAAIEKLRSLLEERAELTKSMAGIAPTVDLDLDEDGLDEARFAALAATLPTDLEQRSERWLRQFFGGSREETKSYTVLRGPFTLPETLGSAEVYPTGAKVELTKVESAKLLAELRPRIAEVLILERLIT